jgi:hypothetical protein
VSYALHAAILLKHDRLGKIIIFTEDAPSMKKNGLGKREKKNIGTIAAEESKG